jgi:hypothetical protein
MNGIEQLRAFISSGKPTGMAVSLAFQLVEVGDGFAAFEGFRGYMRTTHWELFMVAMRRRFWTLPAVARFIPSSPPAMVTPPSNLRLRITKRSAKRLAKFARKRGFYLLDAGSPSPKGSYWTKRAVYSRLLSRRFW